MSGYMARNPLMPPEAPSWLPPEDAAVLERLRSPAALNPLLGPDPYGGAAIGTSSTAPQAQAVDANGQPFDPVVGRGLPVTRGQLAGIAESAWQTAGAVSDGGIGTAGGAVGAIKAYHGSPHSFDRFDMSKIGTGEGAQAYGHGLYFAGNEGVARSYRDTLSRAHGVGITDPATGRVYKPGDPYYDDAAKMLGRPGKMYEVNLDVEPHQLLDWDKTVQSPHVQNVLAAKFGIKPP
ncbi:MAG TPA: hypothetical protein VJY85_00870, partial [Candidatus Limnocylindria bacterium]|nr:hypothetical protein [Candidatus Limnocylindria bacterium]